MRPIGVVTLFLALLATPCFAIDCEAIQGLLAQHVPADIVAWTIRNSAPAPTAGDLFCLDAAHAPPEVLTAVRQAQVPPGRSPPLTPAELPAASTLNSDPTEPDRWDCLAGLCLNAASSAPISGAVVKIGGRYSVWRTVEVCAGRIVSIETQRVFVYGNVTVEAPASVIDSGRAISSFHDFLERELSRLGWVATGASELSDGMTAAQFYAKVGVQGRRWASLTLVHDDYGALSWAEVGLGTVHGAKESLCASRDAEGLK